jgi:hypothetical protein
MADEIEDLAGDAQHFDRAKWILTGQTYPTNPPGDMRAYYDTLFEIPNKYQSGLIPDDSINVLDFIKLALPKTTSAILTYSAKKFFSKESQNEDIQCLVSCDIPSKSFIDDAKLESGQAMLDGAMSIEDPQYKGGHLPLWSITFWDEMYAIRQEQQIWQQSVKWLSAKVDNSARITTINECWKIIGGMKP